jgi:hypothetical protein
MRVWACVYVCYVHDAAPMAALANGNMAIPDVGSSDLVPFPHTADNKQKATAYQVFRDSHTTFDGGTINTSSHQIQHANRECMITPCKTTMNPVICCFPGHEPREIAREDARKSSSHGIQVEI